MRSRTALVTGASTGIGEATARRLATGGWTVLAGVRREDDGQRLVANVAGDLRPVMLDVTNEDDLGRLPDLLEQELGRRGLGALVNNAGVGLGGPLEYLPLQELRDQTEVNVIAPIAVLQAARSPLRTARGRVVMIGSIAGRVAAPNLGPYAASKHALAALSESLRAELHSTGIRVSLIEPGAVATPIWDKSLDRAADLRGRLPDEALRRYADLLDHTEKVLADSQRHAVPAEKVAAAVERALTARRPRHRYLVGPDARLVGPLLRVLPDRLRGVLVRKIGAVARPPWPPTVARRGVDAR